MLTQSQDICAPKSSPRCPLISNTTLDGVISPPTPDSYGSFFPPLILRDYSSPIRGGNYSALSNLFSSPTRGHTLANFQGLIKGHRELGSKKFTQMKMHAACVLLLREVNSNS